MVSTRSKLGGVETRATTGALPLVIALLSTLLTTAHAVAARPLATDDAGVLARGDCEAELYGSRLDLVGSTREATGSAQLSCGFGANAQAAIGYGHTNRHDADNGGRNEAVTAAAKLRLFETTNGHAFALAAGSVMGRTGSAPFQFDSVYVNSVWSGGLAENVTGHASLGWARSRSDSADRTTWNLALELALKKGLDVGVEWYGDDRTPSWLGMGLRFAVTDKVVLGVSLAVQSESLRQRLISAGLTVGF